MGVLADSVRSWFGGWGSGDRVLARLFGGQPVAAGVVVDEQRAMGYAPFAAAVTLIANTLATVPLHVYERVGEGRERARAHPLDRLVSSSPNTEDSSFTFRRRLMYDALVFGVGYAEIQRNGAGRVVGLWHVEADRVTPAREEGGGLVYRVRQERGGEARLAPDKLLVILGSASPDGITPSSTVHRGRQAIGLGLAAETYGASFFGNGAWPGLIAQHPAKLSDQAHTRLKASLNGALQGPTRAHSLIVTEEGIKIEKVGIPPDSGQFLETRQHQINEIARHFNLPPTLIGGHLEGGLTYANNLAEAQRFVDVCLLPLGALWEQELDRKLLATAERDTHYFQMSFEGLLAGDVTTRYSAYKVALDSGFMTVNEVRARENLPALDVAPRPLAPTNGTAPSAAGPRGGLDQAVHAVVADALGRVTRRWADPFIRAGDAAAVRDRLAKLAAADPTDGYMTQVLTTALALVPGVDVRGLARAQRAACVQSIQQVLDSVAAESVPGRVVKVCDIEWPAATGRVAAELIQHGGIHHA